MDALLVTKVGAYCTIQDHGRLGYRRYGIPQAGSMDVAAMQHANILVENQINTPVIENAMMPLELKALHEVCISITGAVADVYLNQKQIRGMYQRISLSPGDHIRISPPTDGMYTYMAIRGQIKASSHLGSYATYTQAGLGGFERKGLTTGQRIELSSTLPHTNAGGNVKPEKHSLEIQNDIYSIPIHRGPEWRMLQALPSAHTFSISPQTSRMGIRLQGTPLAIESYEMRSSAVWTGVVQLPPDYQPIILMKDAQTTGGYPRIAYVDDRYLDHLAQLKPGIRVRMIEK